ncbi:MAG: hypothetical protein BEU05_03565 [Marine Group III euryarchaeote CG-Bathy2]|uniref:UDP-glucose 6-dehydrogenase n=1 Tax=Marine Group III euryarchaeote CG-Bathy2 TaxID=1889002 RepID=A0A1J5SSU9_9ARCH|nr:MAG: hypothetical protein BEU05_03565 [Marine Group III euryarchaeote CG-Bathy2]
MRIAVMGTGYVGLVTGATLAASGHDVTCLDILPERVAALNAGECPIFEPGLPELLAAGLASGKLRGSGEMADEISAADLTFICVGTPSRDDGSMDMAQVESAAAAIGDVLAGDEREHVVVVKSTVLPRTTEELLLPRVLERSGRDRASVGFAMNPEFLREGSAVADALAPDRIVIGAADGMALAKLRELYVGAKCPVLECDPRTAEMVKYASNAFLAAKVSYANEVANLCEAWGIDFATVAEGMGLDDRISPRFLRAGAGYGGSCFPKDVKALRAAAASENLPATMLDATLAVNESQPLLLVAWARDALGSLEGKRVAILGLAFKPETDDVREARAAVVARALLEAGASVVGCDPQAAANFDALCDIEIAPSAEATLDGADCAILMTEWPEYTTLPPAVFAERMARPLLLDGRRAFDAAAMREAGVEYRAIGLGGSE